MTKYATNYSSAVQEKSINAQLMVSGNIFFVDIFAAGSTLIYISTAIYVMFDYLHDWRTTTNNLSLFKILYFCALPIFLKINTNKFFFFF